MTLRYDARPQLEEEPAERFSVMLELKFDAWCVPKSEEKERYSFKNLREAAG